MIVEKKLLKKLEQIGTSGYEANVWMALLSRGVSTTSELSEISKVPRSRAYDVLESLVKKGFIIQKIGKPMKYIAVRPEEVIERVKRNIEQDRKDKITILDNLRRSSVLEELQMLHKQGIDPIDPTEFTSVIEGKRAIQAQILRMIKGASSSVVLTQGIVQEKRIMKIRKRACPITLVEMKPSYCVSDDEHILFLVNQDEGDELQKAILVTSKHFAQGLVSMVKLAKISTKIIAPVKNR